MLVSLLAAGAVALLANRLHWLTAGGAIAAAAMGAATLEAGTGWVVLLLTFFISSNLLSRWRRLDRERIAGSIAAKGDRRDAMQVIANGGVFAVAAIGATVFDVATWQALGAGAIAAATADTWSTEVGTVLGGTNRTIIGGVEVPPGTSGGVTVAGSTAGLCGALLAALVVQAVDWEVPIVAVLAGGVAGSTVDSILGETLQERRWCEVCSAATERPVHRCGNATRVTGGIRGMTNDVVNLACCLIGAAVTWVLA